MSHVKEVGEKLKSALDAVEDAKQALVQLDADDLKALSNDDYEYFEDTLMRLFLASMVRRMVDCELRHPMELMRISTERVLELLREVETHVGRQKADSQGGDKYPRTRAGIFAEFDPRE